MSRPLVSIIMSVHNSEPYISEAVSSILAQTYSNYELIIVDDGSTDNSIAQISNFPFNKIKLLKNKNNKGLPYCLNWAISEANGQYIARMDSDDISLSNRIERQVQFMERNPSVSICGTWVKTFGHQDPKVWMYPLNNDELKAHALFENPFAHSSVLFRKKDLQSKSLLYDEKFLRAQDYELWARAILEGLQLANLPEVLLEYRLHPSQAGKNFRHDQKKVSRLVHSRLIHQVGLDPNDTQLNLHEAIAGYQDVSFVHADNWLDSLFKNNLRSKFIGVPEIQKVFQNRLKSILFRSNMSAWNCFSKYFNSKARESKCLTCLDLSKVILRRNLRRL